MIFLTTELNGKTTYIKKSKVIMVSESDITHPKMIAHYPNAQSQITYEDKHEEYSFHAKEKRVRSSSTIYSDLSMEEIMIQLENDE